MSPINLPPIPRHFTKTIAARSFICKHPTGNFSILVEFGEPTRDVAVIDGFDWRCPIRFTVGTEVTERSIAGIDSLQALQLAISFARAELETMATRPDTVLWYLDQPIDTSPPDWQRSLL